MVRTPEQHASLFRTVPEATATLDTLRGNLLTEKIGRCDSILRFRR